MADTVGSQMVSFYVRLVFLKFVYVCNGNTDLVHYVPKCYLD